MILTVPVCCMTHMAPYYFYNGFSEYWYKEHLKENNFEIREFVRTNNYFSHICGELSWIKYMTARYCKTDLSPEEMWLILKSMDLLMQLAEKGAESAESLSSGSMVLAEKRVV